MSDVASFREVLTAAQQLYRTCVASGQRTQGGYVRNLGERELDIVPHLLYYEVPIRPGDIGAPYPTYLILEKT